MQVLNGLLKQCLLWGTILLVHHPIDASIAFSTASEATLKTNRDSDCGKRTEHCVGRRTYLDGSVYEGEFRFGKAHGWGKMQWADGSHYEGEFQNDLRHVRVYQLLAYVAEYDGEWRLGLMNGRGNYTFACGHRYIGDFVDNLMDGHGTILMSSWESYEGAWRNNVPDGAGVFTRVDGHRYLGPSKRGKRHGAGILEILDWARLEANWEKDVINGRATLRFTDGFQIIMQWKKGEVADRLTVVSPDGQAQETDWTSIHHDFFQIKPHIALAWYLAAVEYTNQDKLAGAQDRLRKAKLLAGDHNALGQWARSQREAIQQRKTPKDCF